MNKGYELGGGKGELRLGHCRWVRQGRKHSGERSGLEIEVGEGDVIGHEVTWRKMVGTWRERVSKRPRGLCDGESQPWLHVGSICRDCGHTKELRPLSGGPDLTGRQWEQSLAFVYF